MQIKHWMTPDPISVEPDLPLIDAQQIMKKNRIRRLPVVEKGKLVGMVTHRIIREASPSTATSLSIHELNYLIVKLKVKDVMRKDPITVSPNDLVIDVILKGSQKGIGAFPVVDQGKLVGIVTESEILRSMLHIFGTRTASEIIELKNLGDPGTVGDFHRISGVIKDLNVPILAMFTLPDRDTGEYRAYVRVKTKDIEPVYEALEKAGYQRAEA